MGSKKMLSKWFATFTKNRGHLLLSVLSIVLLSMEIQAQDKILKNDKTEIKAKVIEITEEEVKYKKYEFQDGPTYTIKKTTVDSIIYQNGDKETFSTAPQPPTKSTHATKVANPTENTSLETIPDKKENSDTAPQTPPHKFARKKKQNRLILAGSWTKYNRYKKDEYLNSPDKESHPPIETLPGAKLAFESFNLAKGLQKKFNYPNIGIGFEYNNYLFFTTSIRKGNTSEMYEMNKHFLNGYVFVEADVKKIISGGILAGPSLNYNTVKYYYDDNTPGRYGVLNGGMFAGGIHVAEYLQKYILTSKKKGGSLFVRVGWDQYITMGSGISSGVYIAVGF